MAVTVRDIQDFKERGERFAMLTCYDSTSARLLDEAGIPLIFIGDTLGEMMLGYSSTVPVTMEEMLHQLVGVEDRADACDLAHLGPLADFESLLRDWKTGLRSAR